MTYKNSAAENIDYLAVSLFTVKILNLFQKSKELACNELIKRSNDVDILNYTGDEINKMSFKLADLSVLTELESQFLELVNQHPEKISVYDVYNCENFYKALTEWRFQIFCHQ
jgi:hypothetical protein